MDVDLEAVCQQACLQAPLGPLEDKETEADGVHCIISQHDAMQRRQRQDSPSASGAPLGSQPTSSSPVSACRIRSSFELEVVSHYSMLDSDMF